MVSIRREVEAGGYLAISDIGRNGYMKEKE